MSDNSFFYIKLQHLLYLIAAFLYLVAASFISNLKLCAITAAQ